MQVQINKSANCTAAANVNKLEILIISTVQQQLI